MNSDNNQSKPIEIIRIKRTTEVVQSHDQNIKRILRTTTVEPPFTPRFIKDEHDAGYYIDQNEFFKEICKMMDAEQIVPMPIDEYKLDVIRNRSK